MHCQFYPVKMAVFTNKCAEIKSLQFFLAGIALYNFFFFFKLNSGIFSFACADFVVYKNNCV